MKTIITNPAAAFSDTTDAPGTSAGNATGNLDMYKNVVYSMSNKEHLTNDTYKTSGDE